MDRRNDDAVIATAGFIKREFKVHALTEHINRQIVDTMELTEGADRDNNSTIYSKLNVTTRMQAAAWAEGAG